MKLNLRINYWLKYRRIPILKYFVRIKILKYGADIPNSVIIGKNVKFLHNGIGVVINL